MAIRVLHVLDHSWPVLDGYAQRSRSIVNAQRDIDMQPTVLTGPLHQFDDPRADETQLDGISYFRTTHGKGSRAFVLRHGWPVLRELSVVALLRSRIKSILSAGRYDIVHAHSPALCGLAAAQAACCCGLPFVYELRAFWEDAAIDQGKTTQQSMRYLLSRRLETHVVRRAAAVVGIAQSILDELESRGVDRSKLFHVPNGVDIGRFSPRERDSELAASLDLNGAPTLGFIGTLFPWEGIAWLVRAAAALRKKGARFKLLIVGDGAEAGEVRRAIEENNSTDFVSFLGRVPHDQIERYYSVMDVLVYPRRSIRLTELVTPLKPLEAMALGKTILGSSVGGIRELVEPEVTGVLFEPGDHQSFERQLTRLLADDSLRRSLGERARQRMIEERDWKTLVRKYEAVYHSAAHSHRLPDRSRFQPVRL